MNKIKKNLCVLPEDMTWEDCKVAGHEEGCYVMVCPQCGTRFPDCEDKGEIMETITREVYYNIGEVIQANRRIGQYFFSDGAKRFFNSRIGGSVYGGRYFITSEQFDRDRSPRLYTVRECVNGDIQTVGEFQQYETHAQARAAINKLLRQGE